MICLSKSYYHNLHKETTLDSDSSNFSWIVSDGVKIRNPEFPTNYINHIKENIGKYEFIFVSSHKEVRDALLDNNIFFYLIYPNMYDKDKFIQRYKERGSPESFIELVLKNWDSWIRECEFCNVGCENISMVLPNLSNELSHIICSEGGDSES